MTLRILQKVWCNECSAQQEYWAETLGRLPDGWRSTGQFHHSCPAHPVTLTRENEVERLASSMRAATAKPTVDLSPRELPRCTEDTLLQDCPGAEGCPIHAEEQVMVQSQREALNRELEQENTLVSPELQEAIREEVARVEDGYEAPEVNESTLSDAIITRPGESLVETVQAARTGEPQGVHVVNAEAEGVLVYVLLSDGRILKHEYEDARCAEVGREQVLRLQLEPEKMVNWFDWTELTAEEVAALG